MCTLKGSAFRLLGLRFLHKQGHREVCNNDGIQVLHDDIHMLLSDWGGTLFLTMLQLWNPGGVKTAGEQVISGGKVKHCLPSHLFSNANHPHLRVLCKGERAVEA